SAISGPFRGCSVADGEGAVGSRGQGDGDAVEVGGAGDPAAGQPHCPGSPQDPGAQCAPGVGSGGQAVEQAGEHAVAGADGRAGTLDHGAGVHCGVTVDEHGSVAAEADGDRGDATEDEIGGCVDDV